MQINETWRAHLKSYLRSTLMFNGLHDHAAGKVITRVNMMKVLHNLTRWENNLENASRCALRVDIQFYLSFAEGLFSAEFQSSAIFNWSRGRLHCQSKAVWKTILLSRPKPINLISWCMHSRSSQCFFFFSVSSITHRLEMKKSLCLSMLLSLSHKWKQLGTHEDVASWCLVDVFWHKNRTTGWSPCLRFLFFW